MRVNYFTPGTLLTQPSQGLKPHGPHGPLKWNSNPPEGSHLPHLYTPKIESTPSQLGPDRPATISNVVESQKYGSPGGSSV